VGEQSRPLSSSTIMARVIEGQVVASTALDAHGEQLTREELRELYSQMPDQRSLNLNHDPRKPPIARTLNTYLDEIPEGILAIKSDIEVLDEAQFASLRGMSIAYHRTSERGETPVHRPSIVISFNPREIDRERLAAVLSSSGLPSGYVELSERSEKSLVVTIALIFAIVSRGFWNEAGADAWRLFKRLVQEGVTEGGQAEFAAISEADSTHPQLIICPLIDFDPNIMAVIDEEDILSQAQALAPSNKLVKVVAQVDQAGLATINFAVDREGNTIYPRSKN
jgi:hypothetical protein